MCFGFGIRLAAVKGEICGTYCNYCLFLPRLFGFGRKNYFGAIPIVECLQHSRAMESRLITPLVILINGVSGPLE